mgnify:CR=1 FL=1
MPLSPINRIHRREAGFFFLIKKCIRTWIVSTPRDLSNLPLFLTVLSRLKVKSHSSLPSPVMLFPIAGAFFFWWFFERNI